MAGTVRLRPNRTDRKFRQEKPLSFNLHVTVPETDTGRRGEYPQTRVRTLQKELGKLAPYVRYKGRLPRKRRPQKRGSIDCLSKTQLSANSEEDV
jgi:hypothetical protein